MRAASARGAQREVVAARPQGRGERRVPFLPSVGSLEHSPGQVQGKKHRGCSGAGAQKSHTSHSNTHTHTSTSHTICIYIYTHDTRHTTHGTQHAAFSCQIRAIVFSPPWRSHSGGHQTSSPCGCADTTSAPQSECVFGRRVLNL